MSSSGLPGAPSLGAGQAVVAIDVGGTTTKVATIAPDGTVSPPRRVPSPPAGVDSAEAVVDLARELLAQERAALEAPVAALGIALPGIVVEERGLGVYSENLGWRDVDFARLLGDAIDIPVAIGHDVRSAGIAELTLGAASGTGTALVIAIGTGISAAVQVEGRLLSGGGFAGEIGHAVVVPGGEPCLCGGRGCLEAIASAGAIARRYSRDAGVAVSGAKEVLARAAAGDPVALAVREDAFDALALALSHAICMLAPEVIVLGGGLSEAREALLDPLTQRLEELVRVSPVPPLRRAQLGEDAGLIGAGVAARRLLAQREPVGGAA